MQIVFYTENRLPQLLIHHPSAWGAVTVYGIWKYIPFTSQCSNCEESFPGIGDQGENTVIDWTAVTEQKVKLGLFRGIHGLKRLNRLHLFAQKGSHLSRGIVEVRQSVCRSDIFTFVVSLWVPMISQRAWPTISFPDSLLVLLYEFYGSKRVM